ncbi:MAG: TolB family protein [Candidatus Brocadiales bacterium]|nr:TolB family protein [Candidatus Bathyanammoxibius sp.]
MKARLAATSFVLFIIISFCDKNPVDNSETKCPDEGPPTDPIEEPQPAFQLDLHPAWSPDGQWIAYTHFNSDSLPAKAYEFRLIDPESLEKRLVRYGISQSMDWFPSSDSLIVTSGDQLYILGLDGLFRRQLTTSGMNYFPDISHDGRWLAWDVNYWDIWLMNLETGETWPIQKDSKENGGAWRQPSWSPDDSFLVHIRYGDYAPQEGHETIYIMTRDGKTVKRLTFEAKEYLYPLWSPDGRRIAFASRECEWLRDVFIYDLETDEIKRVTFEGAEGFSWSPDGRNLVYSKYNAWVNSKRSGLLYILDVQTLEERQISFDEVAP